MYFNLYIIKLILKYIYNYKYKMSENITQVKTKPKKLKIKKKQECNEDIQKIEVKYNDNSDIKLINGDCLIEMDKIDDNSINCIITDLPYGVSLNKWDTIIDLEKMWMLFKKILKKDGIVILTASGKFVAKLMMSNISMFKYDIIWEKTVNSGQLNVKRMPLRSHENILIFYNKNKTYNEQKTVGETI
jgi:hypothetical protein